VPAANRNDSLQNFANDILEQKRSTDSLDYNHHMSPLLTSSQSSSNMDARSEHRSHEKLIIGDTDGP
jgi:hypothetical protein